MPVLLEKGQGCRNCIRLNYNTREFYSKLHRGWEHSFFIVGYVGDWDTIANKKSFFVCFFCLFCFLEYSSTVHLPRKLCRSCGVVDFSFADVNITLLSIQCVTQKFHEVKKISVQSLLMGTHFALSPTLLLVICFLQHPNAQIYKDLHSVYHGQHVFLCASQR